MKTATKTFIFSTTTATVIASLGFVPLASFPQMTSAQAQNIPSVSPSQPQELKSEKVSNKLLQNSEEEATLGYPNSINKEGMKAKEKPKPEEKKEPAITESPSQPQENKEETKSLQEEKKEKVEDHTKFNTEGLSKEQIKWITTAAQASKQKIPAGFFRAVAEQESDIRPDVFYPDRNGGTWGIWQINEYLTGKYYDGGNFSTDRNKNGIPDVQEPMISAKIAAAYFDDLYVQIKKLREKKPNELWVKDMTLLESVAIAHNAGPTGMRKYPNFRTPSVTDKYLRNMKKNIPLYSTY